MKTRERLKYLQPGGSWRDLPFDLLPEGMKRARRSDHTKRYGRLRYEGLAGTVMTKCDPHWGAVFLPDQDRGTITFCWYDLGPKVKEGRIRSLVQGGSFTTTIDQLTLALDRAIDLPEAGVYERAIKAALGR